MYGKAFIFDTALSENNFDFAFAQSGNIYPIKRGLLEKVISAVQLVVPGEALAGQHRAALHTPKAAGVPGAVRHLQHIPIHDHLVTAAAFRDTGCNIHADVKH